LNELLKIDYLEDGERDGGEMTSGGKMFPTPPAATPRPHSLMSDTTRY